jgi:hypothetical protein
LALISLSVTPITTEGWHPKNVICLSLWRLPKKSSLIGK